VAGEADLAQLASDGDVFEPRPYPSCPEIRSSTAGWYRRAKVTPLLSPWQFMLLTLAGWNNRRQ
jgi:hypothetical protein